MLDLDVIKRSNSVIIGAFIREKDPINASMMVVIRVLSEKPY
jgi:hypothetical protein